MWFDGGVTTITATVLIEAPPAAVADVLLDAAAAPLWTSGLRSLELVAGESGRPGSVGRAVYDEGGRTSVFEDRLLEVSPNQRYVSALTGPGLCARIETTLDAVEAETTRVTVRWSGTGTAPMARVALPLLRRRIARRSERDLMALKRLTEERWSSR